MVLHQRVGLIGVAVRPADAHRRGLVDDQDALPVAKSIKFLGIGVMAGPQGVGPKPVHEMQVGDVGHLVQAAAVERAVLVLAEAFQVDRVAVEQQLGALYLHLPDAEGLLIAVLPKGDAGGVEVGRARPGLPQLRVRHSDAARGPLCPGHQLAGRVQDLH